MPFFVVVFTDCMARSARCTSSSLVRACSGKDAIPNDAVIDCAPCDPRVAIRKGRPEIASRTLSATSVAPCHSVSGSTMQNSSPPNRNSLSNLRILPRTRSDTSRSVRLPAAWPSRVFTSFRLSMSKKISDIGVLNRLARDISSRMNSSK